MRRFKVCIAFILSLTLVMGMTGVSMAETGLPHGADVKMEEDVSAEAVAMVKDGDFVKDEIIVVFKDSVSDQTIKNVANKQDTEVVKITEAAESEKIAIAEIEKKDSVAEAITRLSRDKNVLHAQPNYKYKTNAEGKDPYNNNDPMNQWYLDNIKARDAWKTMDPWKSNLTKTKVAVIDTGIDTTHKDIQANLNKDLSKKKDGNGGFKALKYDSDDHGTHVSGIIGATYNNKLGISGVAAGTGNNAVEMMVFDASTQDALFSYFSTEDIVSSLIKAEEQGAKVINMSFGGEGRDRILEGTLESLYQKGVTLVAAAGNDSTDAISNPSDVGEVISVCSTTRENKVSDFSDYGMAKDIAAPGSSIKSTVPGSQYDNLSGTSMSSPMVAAAAAMVLSVNPELTPAQVKNILCATADGSVGSDETGFDPETGYGLLNIDEAVKAAKTASKAVPITDLSFKQTRMKLNVNDAQMIETLAKPANSLENIRWSVEPGKEDIVKVDQNGKVTGLKHGEAKVFAITGNERTATCTVSVNQTYLVEKIDIKNKADFENITVGESGALSVKVLPIDAENKSVYWKSDDKAIAEVDETGSLYAKKVGTTTIHAYSFDGVEDSMTVVVWPKVKSVTITDKPSSNKLKMGSSFEFKAESLPTDTLPQEITWSSSNRSIATVSSNGVVTPVKPGKTTITAKTKSGKSDSVRITIYKTKYSGTAYNLKTKVVSSSSVKLTWKSIPNADGYEIYQRASGSSSYKKVKTVKGTTKSYTAKKLKKGKRYAFKVRAYYTKGGKKEVCSYSAVKTATPKKVK